MREATWLREGNKTGVVSAIRIRQEDDEGGCERITLGECEKERITFGESERARCSHGSEGEQERRIAQAVETSHGGLQEGGEEGEAEHEADWQHPLGQACRRNR